MPLLDLNTVVFLQQQLERVLAFMRTVDARLDALERTSHHLLEQNERLTKQLSQQQRSAPPAAAAAASLAPANVSGGVCPLCGVHFGDSNELQAHASVCLDKREQRHGSSGGGGLFGRVLGKH